MLFFFAISSPDPGPSPLSGARHDYARLITENLPFIERQCRRAVQKPSGFGEEDGADGIDLENQADELFNEVLDRLRAEEFKALREFRGQAKLTTYLTTIVANLVVDLVRQKKGRSRARERAREMGEVAERLYELVYGRGCTPDQAHSHLEIDHGIKVTPDLLGQMLDRMRGRGERSQMVLAADPEEAWLVPGRAAVGEEGIELVVADPRRNAEARLIQGEREGQARKAVAALVGELSGEERFLLTLRFPVDESEPKSFKQIAQILGGTESGVDTKIRRILLRFKEALLRQGLSLSDLV